MLCYPILSNTPLTARVQVIVPRTVADLSFVRDSLLFAAGGVTSVDGEGAWKGDLEPVRIFTSFYDPSKDFTRVCNALTDICQHLFNLGERTVAIVFNSALHLIVPADLPLCHAIGCPVFAL
jgi:hypothetical protein